MTLTGKWSLRASLAISAGLMFGMSHAAAAEGRQLDPGEREIVASVVGDALKDPDSAKFKWSAIPQPVDAGPALYCAKVNAKNSYGGYVGYSAFSVIATFESGKVVEASDLSLAGEPSSPLNRQMRKECLTAGFGDLFPGELTDADIKRQSDAEIEKNNEAIRRARQIIEEMERRTNQ